MTEREMFQTMGPDIENPAEFVKGAEAKFNEAMDRLAQMEAEAMASDKPLSPDDIGIIVGKAFVRYVASKYDKPELISSISQEIKEILPVDIAERFIAGFLAEHAVAQALTSQVGKEVYYSTPAEDGEQKIDWVIKEPGVDKEIFVQVKTLPVADPDFDKLFFTVESKADMEYMAEALYSLRFIRDIAISNYIKEAEEMLKANENNNNRLVFIFVPSDEVNPVSGTLTNKNLISELDAFFAEI